MTLPYSINSFDWKLFSIHYEEQVLNRYRNTPSMAAYKINRLREIYEDLKHADILPDVVIEKLMEQLVNDRGEIAAFCDPEQIEDTENLIEGYEWCIVQLGDKSVSRNIRSFCAAQVGSFDEMLQEEEIDI